MKVLMYVDGENIEVQQLREVLEKLREYHASYEVSGKVYGNKQNMGEVFNICLSHGLDYIDTSSLSTKKKNVADMKLTVDAADDVLNLYKGQVYKVFLVSNDVDFVPLVYKLTGHGVLVDSFLCNTENVVYNTKDLAKNLNDYGYLPITDRRWFSLVFQDMRAKVPVNVPNEVLDEYIEQRYKNFLEAVEVILTEPEDYARLTALSIRSVSATSVLKRISCSNVISYEVLRIYFQRIFGSTPKKYVLKRFIEEVEDGVI